MVSGALCTLFLSLGERAQLQIGTLEPREGRFGVAKLPESAGDWDGSAYRRHVTLPMAYLAAPRASGGLISSGNWRTLHLFLVPQGAGPASDWHLGASAKGDLELQNCWNQLGIGMVRPIGDMLLFRWPILLLQEPPEG